MNQVALSIAAQTNTPAPGPEVSVVMVVYRTGEALDKAIACVLDEPRIDELIVVDNGSFDDAAERLRLLEIREPRVRLLQGHGNVGFSRGANMGAGAARGRLVVFLNPDAFLQSGCIEALIAGLEGQPPCSIVGACILDPDGSEQRGGRRGEVSALSILLTLSRASRRFAALDAFEIHRNHDAMPAGLVTMPTISGACFAARREEFQALGGFDEGYFLHVEDIDLCWRARRQGGAVLFQPGAKVVHLGHTSNSSPWRVEMHKATGLIRYFLKRSKSAPSYLLALALSPVIMVTALARPLLWQVRGRRA